MWHAELKALIGPISLFSLFPGAEVDQIPDPRTGGNRLGESGRDGHSSDTQTLPMFLTHVPQLLPTLSLVAPLSTNQSLLFRNHGIKLPRTRPSSREIAP